MSNGSHQILKLNSLLIPLIREANRAILEIYKSSIVSISRLKADCSPVTRADLVAHEILVNGLSRITPNIPIISEEDSSPSISVGSAMKYWLIDPLDGTKQFLQGNGEFTCNIALIDRGTSIYGIIGIPASGLIYYGGSHYKAFLIDKSGHHHRISSASIGHSSRTRVITSLSHFDEKSANFIQRLPKQIQLIKAGSSLKFLRIAEGLADIYPRLSTTHEWDTAAGQAILEGAGGSVRNLDGSKLIYGKPKLINEGFVARSKAFTN